MVLYTEYFRVPSQERHFPTWDNHNTSRMAPGPSGISSPFSLSPVSQHLFAVDFFKHIAFYKYVSSFYSRIAPLFFHSPLTLTFFHHQASWLVPQSVFVTLFPCGGIWFVPESGPCIPWKLGTRSRGRTRSWLNLFWQDCFTEGTTLMPCRRRRRALGGQVVPSLECWVWP